MAGAYEREAIRPHVLGRFADMLLAAEGHPAMLIYLDNAQSIGPNSVAGINRDRGLNENLAREILELHTLGVRTVYTQDDVTSFAKVITGWTILPTDTNPEHGGEFLYNPRMHEPGAQTVIGKAYRDTGVEQGRAVLADLARHPATASNRDQAGVAFHCRRASAGAGRAPDAALHRNRRRPLAGLQSAGNARKSWSREQAKIKRPGEWYVAMRRAAGLPAGDGRLLVQGTSRLGEPLWRPRRREDFPTRMAPGSMVLLTGSTSPAPLRRTPRHGSIREPSWKRHSAPLRRRRLAKPSLGPRASRRR